MVGATRGRLFSISGSIIKVAGLVTRRERTVTNSNIQRLAVE